MRSTVIALLCGTLFGFGLCVAEMVNPARIVGFLDLYGRWDATMGFVMITALGVTAVGFPLIMRRAHPVFAERFCLPTKRDLDLPLIGGSILFGVGWGISGLCPGPAIAALVSLSPSIGLFVVAMVAGQWLVSRFE